ncbi:hypothetical protein [Streptomyces liangshanensis]|uniref:Uncharacterized protein n=1 Tax=Streptomyces liangshanensis TaxID=2717324 RepID=A0A6G9GYI5_9ACTN|nr:hypothetical protein [Streptomyces liangshanensis]QIQ02957.1 hypothetical protein HA039_12005 [Streptomyces liangshanensis]
MNRPREIPYSDDLLADGTVHRVYEDADGDPRGGREEWRRREGGKVRWRDNRGASGTDELLGDRVIKRVHEDGRVTYGRDIGYGRTVWGQGETVMVNRTSFGGRAGVVLGGLGLAALAITAAHYPPESLTPEEEEELRQRQEAAGSSSGGDSGGGYADTGDWDSDDDGGWNDDDFG